jgi:hypothetical protein
VVASGASLPAAARYSDLIRFFFFALYERKKEETTGEKYRGSRTR